MNTDMNITTMKSIATSGEKSAAQKQAIEQGKRDERVLEIVRRDTAKVYADTLKKLSRATAAEILRKDVCEIVTIGNVTAHHSQKNVYVVSLKVTHKYIGKTKNFRVQAMPQIKFAWSTEKNTAHTFGTPEQDEKQVIMTYGVPLVKKYFARMERLNASLSMEEMLALRPYNMLTLPEFTPFITSKGNVTQEELNDIADKIAEKNLPDMD